MAELRTVSTEPDLRAAVDAWRRDGLRVGFVPTMGALHEGHLSLVRLALQHADRVVVSIFVNPTQFGPDEDLAAYPRSPEEDCRQLAVAGCDLVFLPEVETIYPPGESTWIEVEGPSRGFEGAERPGHFRGVATVVTKLFGLVRSDVAVFGEKDAQQLALVRRLVRDLHLGVEIVAGPIAREDDGLAMSSRNVYLSAEERRAAGVLHRSLQSARRLIEAGERGADVLAGAVRAVLASEPSGTVDYVAVVDAATFAPVTTVDGPSVVAIAVRFGRTRLLDNIHVDPIHVDSNHVEPNHVGPGELTVPADLSTTPSVDASASGVRDKEILRCDAPS
ncbi:MAG: pantoate--beta-alanine ligase [Acidobacteriota bacterium]